MKKQKQIDELKEQVEELKSEVDRLRARLLDLECAPSIPLPIGVPSSPYTRPYTWPYPRDTINWPPTTLTGTDKGWRLIYGPGQ